MVSALVRSLVMAAAATLVAGAVHAQQFPSRPIKILVGYGAGGGTDTLARLYAQKLQEVLNTPVIVDNKPGAQELLAAIPVMNAPADGYTLWMGTAGPWPRTPACGETCPMTS